MFAEEDEAYLTKQLISYMGNKRRLLPLLADGLRIPLDRLGKEKLSILDGFSGSGVCSRFFKRYASQLIANDLQPYAATLSQCYLRNRSEIDIPDLRSTISELRRLKLAPCDGFFQSMYAPKDEANIQPNDRVFFTRRNALILDNVCRTAQSLDVGLRPLILGPLLSETSIHSNTAGHFKSFLKDRNTKIGCYGGASGAERDVITADIEVLSPVLSRYETDCVVHCKDICDLVASLDEIDVAYFDPPYEAQPYGYLYFMLDLLVTYQRPVEVSEVAGVPQDWVRSQFSTEKDTLHLIVDLVQKTKARFVLLSYSNEGQIAPERLKAALGSLGKLTVLEKAHPRMNSAINSDANKTRGRKGTKPMVVELLYILEKA
jgi:adenine-specific DNA-methyltransferase